MIKSSELLRYSLFDGLEKEQIDSILSLMEFEAFEADTDIVEEGSSNSKIHFILDGFVMVIKDGVKLMGLGEGGVFGEMEVLEILPVEATIRTVTATKVMTLSIDALGEIFETDLKTYSFILMNLARDIARRFRLLNTRVVNESSDET